MTPALPPLPQSTSARPTGAAVTRARAARKRGCAQAARAQKRPDRGPSRSRSFLLRNQQQGMHP